MSGRANYIVVAAVLSVVRASTIESQQTKLAFSPTATDVSISRDVQYAHRDTAVLRMDVYRRPASAPMPAFIFYNRGVGDARRHPVYDGWARTAASRGFVAILPDLRSTSETEDFQALLDHLTTNAATLGIDRDAIAMYAASGNVFRALPIVEDPKQTRVKAAVMYYGAAPISTFRLDLPVLYVRAGLDRADLNVAITTLISRALTQNAPITLLNHHTGYHGFEIFNDDDATRAIIDQTIDFVKVATSQRYQTALHTGLPEAVAAGNTLSGNYRQAAATYGELLRTRADDHRLRLSYGEALLGDRQYAAACGEFEKLKGKGLGPRDLGLPAARACMLKGDPEAAIAWLKTIPTRFLPADVQTDSVFVSLQGRADFRALFPPR